MDESKESQRARQARNPRAMRNVGNALRRDRTVVGVRRPKKKTATKIDVDMEGTQQIFGFTQGFDVEKYMGDFYRQNHPKQAVHHQEELKARRQLVSEALKSYVAEHYSRFIHSSREVVAIESQLLKFAQLLAEYKVSLKSVQEIDLSYDDERLLYEQQMREQDPRFANDSVLGEEIMLEELSQDLRTFMYERKFEKAVELAEDAMQQGKLQLDARDTAIQATLKAEIEGRIVQLVELLTDDLRVPTRKKYERKRIISFLVRLDRADKALHIFLQNRSDFIKSQVRQISFQGDVGVYIRELSHVVFSAIAGSCVDFRRLFQDGDMMSGVMVWAVEELENFGHMFSKQVFQSEDTFSKLGSCLKCAFSGCAELAKKGLWLSYVLVRMFTPSLLEMLANNFRKVEEQIADQLEHEKWEVEELWVHEPHSEGKGKNKGEDKRASKRRGQKRALKLTSSAKFLYQAVRVLLQELVPILDASVYPTAAADLAPTVIQGMVRLFEGYLLTITNRANSVEAPPTDTQGLAMLANAFYLADDLLPRVSRAFSKQLGRPSPELDTFKETLHTLHEALRSNYCMSRGVTWIGVLYRWEMEPEAQLSVRFASDVEETNLAPSSHVYQVAMYLVKLYDAAARCLPKPITHSIVSMALEEIFRALHEDRFWTDMQIGLGGLQQLVLDVHFLLRSSGDFISANDRAQEAAQLLIKRAMGIYCQTHGRQEEDVMRNTEWFDDVVENTVTKFQFIGAILEQDQKEEEERLQNEAEEEKKAQEAKMQEQQSQAPSAPFKAPTASDGISAHRRQTAVMGASYLRQSAPDSVQPRRGSTDSNREYNREYKEPAGQSQQPQYQPQYQAAASSSSSASESRRGSLENAAEEPEPLPQPSSSRPGPAEAPKKKGFFRR